MKGSILLLYYRLRHPNVPYDKIPYYYKRTLIGEVWHLIIKIICQIIAPNCVLTSLRVALYRLCGFKIGKGTFIGMKCYLDDLCIDDIEIGDKVIISYGVYFACHGRKQGHNKILIKNGAYIGMRANITARHDLVIGEGAIVGAGSLVNKNVPDGATCVGVPGRILGNKE